MLETPPLLNHQKQKVKLKLWISWVKISAAHLSLRSLSAHVQNCNLQDSFQVFSVPGVFLEILRNLSWTENILISLNSTSMATIIPGLASACDAFAKSYLAQVFGLKIHQSMRPTGLSHHATPPNSRWFQSRTWKVSASLGLIFTNSLGMPGSIRT